MRIYSPHLHPDLCQLMFPLPRWPCHASAASGCGRARGRCRVHVEPRHGRGRTVLWAGPRGAIPDFRGRALPLSKAVAFVGLVLVVGQAFIVLNGIFGDQPISCWHCSVYSISYASSYRRGTGWPVIFLCLVIAITVTLLDRVHETLDSSIIAILLQAYLSAVVLSWLAHAILPGHDATEDAPQAAPVMDRPAMRALADAAILLGRRSA